MCRGDIDSMSSFTTMSDTMSPEFIVGGRQSTCQPQQEAPGPDHWWKDLSSEECALTGFPLSLLPYPPFRFRMDPNDPENCKAVDAKYLVLQVIATGEFQALGRNLVDSDVTALDQHVRRCNLGRFRLSNFIRLQKDVMDARSAEERTAAESTMRTEQDDARKQFRKLQHIQNHRLKDLKKQGKKVAKKKAAPQRTEAPRAPPKNQVSSQQVVLAKPSAPFINSVPRVVRWADASVSDDGLTRLLGPNVSMSFLENLQHWRSSTESAKSGKGDEIMSRRLENVSWRLWASGADPAVCAPDFLLELDKKNNVPQLQIKSSSSGISLDRGRQPEGQSPVLKIEEIFTDKPSVVLQSWRVSTKEPKIEIIDGQARSRRENQLWRLMALSQKGDPRSQAIVQKVCANNPVLPLQVGAQTPVALGMHVPTSSMSSDSIPRTPSPGNFVSHTSSVPRADSSIPPSPNNTGRTWLRTPSPEFRPWMAATRPMPVLAPRPAGNPGPNPAWHVQGTAASQNQGYYVQPVAVPMPQVGLLPVAPLQTGVCVQMMTPAMPSTSSMPEDYVCVAVPKHMVQQIQDELGQPRCRSRN